MNEAKAIVFLRKLGYKVVKQGKGRPPMPKHCGTCGKLCATTVEARRHCPRQPKGEA
jgi:hypothetical protein